MKKITLESIRTIMVGLILSLGIGIAFAWTGPSVAPTGGNVTAPLNVSSAPQVKQGNLWLSGLDASSNPYTNGLIVQNGNVGIGTTNPKLKLDVNAGGTTPSGSPSTSGTAPIGYAVVGSGFNNNLYMGSMGAPSYGFWMQGADSTDLSHNYPLLLNPNGGNVGIGTTNPTYKLAVGGNVAVDGPIFGQIATGAGDVLYVGNDSTLSDINVANTMGVYGRQDTTVGSIKLGSGGGAISGYNGNVGINKTNPSYPLDVSGYVNATGVCIGSDCRGSWPRACPMNCSWSTVSTSNQQQLVCGGRQFMAGAAFPGWGGSGGSIYCCAPLPNAVCPGMV